MYSYYFNYPFHKPKKGIKNNEESKGAYKLLKKMRGLTPIMMIAVVLFLIMPMGKSFAASYVDGEYDVSVNALHADKDESSVAVDYINEGAKVIVNGGEAELRVTVPKDEEFALYSLKKQGASERQEEDDNNLYYYFNLDETDINNAMINVVTSYEVPSMDFVHENVEFRFQITGLDNMDKESDGEGENQEQDDSGDSEEKSDDKEDNADVNDNGATPKSDDSNTGGKEDNNTGGKTEEDSNAEDNPKTGDEAPIIFLTIVLLGSGLFLVRKLAIK